MRDTEPPDIWWGYDSHGVPHLIINVTSSRLGGRTGGGPFPWIRNRQASLDDGDKKGKIVDYADGAWVDLQTGE